MTKLFFATDIHGSDICWSKFLNAGKFYEADVLDPRRRYDRQGRRAFHPSGRKKLPRYFA